jgi:predicted AAA+ superfamily ATPase
MIERTIKQDVIRLLKDFPAVAILGPRQSGKTTLAKSVASIMKKQVVYIDLEKASDRNALADPEIFFAEHRKKLVVIDEIQVLPQLFTVLRPEIDEYRKSCRFLITGSAAPELVKGVSESLAGRIAYKELTPINLTEAVRQKISLRKHWHRGGFPSALLARNNDMYYTWTENFVRSYIERDLTHLFGVAFSASLVRRFLTMLAGNNGGIWNSEKFASSLSITGPTANRYLDYLEAAYIIRKLPAWGINPAKRLVKAPKIFFRDTGMLHYFNHIHDAADLPSNLVVGSSWEGYVIEEIIRHLPKGYSAYYYRTHHGAEVDLVIAKGITPIVCVEVKYGVAPNISQGFYLCANDLKTKLNCIVYSGDKNYKNASGAEFISLQEFLIKIQKLK